MPRRPGADIRNGCPVESVSPDHVPPVPDPISLRQNLGTLSSPLCLPWTPQINGLAVKARLGGRPPSLLKPVNSSSHRWHEFPTRLFPPHIWAATRALAGLDISAPVNHTRLVFAGCLLPPARIRCGSTDSPDGESHRDQDLEIKKRNAIIWDQRQGRI